LLLKNQGGPTFQTPESEQRVYSLAAVLTRKDLDNRTAAARAFDKLSARRLSLACLVAITACLGAALAEDLGFEVFVIC
jgi:hypothetical protein